MTTPVIRELIDDEALRAAYPVMHQLRTHLSEDAYLDGTRQMMQKGYRLLAVEAGERIVALAGVEVCFNLYHGRHVWVYDLVTAADARSRGYGKMLLRYVEDFARRHGCKRVALASGLQRTDAHRFYRDRMTMDATGYVFVKVLETGNQ